MIDDPLEWLAVALDDDEPTVPDVPVDGWSPPDPLDDQTLPVLALDDDGDYTLDLGLE